MKSRTVAGLILIVAFAGLFTLGTWRVRENQRQQMERELEEWQRLEWFNEIREQRYREFEEQLRRKLA